MMTSKQRAELRAQANTLDTILMIGKGGISDMVIAETEKLLDARELVKGRVLESAMLTAREASDELCARTGADGIQAVGSKFVIYRKSEKLERERTAASKPAKPAAKKVNPVKAGVRNRRRAAKLDRERRDKYFHDAAVNAAIERRRQREQQDG